MAEPAPVQPPQAAQLLWDDGQRADHGPGVDYGNLPIATSYLLQLTYYLIMDKDCKVQSELS